MSQHTHAFAMSSAVIVTLSESPRSETHAVDSRFEPPQDAYRGWVVVRKKLHEHGDADSAVWVDPEVGVVFAAPTNGA